MCGIAGVLAGERVTAEQAVLRISAAQRHRGPDADGLKVLDLAHGCLALGHRRLAILDLSAAGRQPMTNPETGDWVVYNGELYNFRELRGQLEGWGARFRSSCDTEVILHAYARWGPDCLARFYGMFALGIYDARGRRLVLARDPLGIKPLYVGRGPSALVFASEVRALLRGGLVEGAADRRALAGLLAYGAVPGPLTMLRDVRLLEPGTWASFDLAAEGPWKARPAVQRFWDFPVPAPAANGRPAPAEVGERLGEAVRSHLLSDVPVGVFLSSGLDSTGVAALAAEARGGDVDAFTLALAGDAAMDENPVARQTAAWLGIRHHAIHLEEEELRGRAQQWLASLDQPSADGLNTYIISRAVRDRGIVVALSGLGGDELFGGYPAFRQVPRWARLGSWVPRVLRRGLAYYLSRQGTKGQRRRALETAAAPARVADLYFRRRRLLSDLEMRALGLGSRELDLDDNFLPPESQPQRVVFPHDPVATVSVLESRFYMGNTLLRDADVFGMAHGLEIRVPLLDRRVADYVYAVGGRMRLRGSAASKPLLAAALAGKIPPALSGLAKRGFCLPQARWLLGPLRPLFEHLLEVTRQSGFVNPGAVTAIWEDFVQEPAGSAWKRAWLLGALGAWLQPSLAPTAVPA